MRCLRALRSPSPVPSRRLSAGLALAGALTLMAAPAAAQIRPNAVMLRYPDVGSREIVFRYDGDLWLVDKEGGVARRLTTAEGNESFPKFSPDDRTVAFVGGYDGGSDLYTLDLEAGAPRRVTHHPAREVLSDWSADGEELIFWSSATAGLARAPEVLRVSAEGGQPTEFPVPYGTFAALDETGRYLAYTPYSREFRTWKRYRGGRTPDIWIFDLETKEARNVTDDPSNDQIPMWHGKDLVFLSDRGEHGVMNLYAYDTEADEVRKLTDYRVFDVRFPSMGPDDVVYEAGGKLYRYEFAGGEPVQVDVIIPGERPELRPRTVEAASLLEEANPGPSATRVVVEARGELFSVPVESGVTRNLTRTSGVAERSPSWSPDGRWIVYFSDRTGEYELTVRRSDGAAFEGADDGGERTLTDLGPGWKEIGTWSPDSRYVTFSNNDGSLHLYDFEGDSHRRIATDPSGQGIQADWSGDSAWLAWSHRHSSSRLDALYLYEVATGTVHEVTSGMFDDSNPVFDRDGDWLWFSSSRTFSPTYADLDTTWVYTNTRNLCAIPLRSDVEDPFAPTNDEEEIEEDDEESGDDPEEDGESSGDEEGDDDEDDDSGDDDASSEEEDDALVIELEGLESRIRVLPVDGGRVGNLEGAHGKVLFVRGPGPDGGKPSLEFFDMEAKEATTIVEGVWGYVLNADRSKILAFPGGGLAVLDVAAGQSIERIDLSGMVASVDPRAEWRQILRDAWRLYRDWFYDEGMHGLDWEAVGDRYADALVDATSREDVHWLIGEMMGELNVGHAYNRGPANLPDSGPARPVGLLGCDFVLDQGAYRIERILGSPYDADGRSPLAAHGVDAREGDWLLAVNGIPVDTDRDVWASLIGTAGKPTLLTLNASPTMDGEEREVLVEPLASETSLRYRDWVARNRATVEEMGGGRIGYVHVPDTGVNGQNELVRQFLGQMHKDALIIDERWNSGGQIPTRFIELLDRPVTNYWALRHGEDWEWPPVGHRGPKAMLINGASGSGGDCFPYYFRQSGLGKLIGTRTWGGLVGISGNPSLIDGANPSVPAFAFYELDGTWGVEGYGVPPDIEVVDDPSKMQDGADPQLAAAIEHLIGELETWEFDVRVRPAGADRRGAGVTPEDR